MAENTKIEWAHHTFNPWEGCQKVGPGCDNCYAEARNARFAGGHAVNWGPGAPRRRTSAGNWAMPVKWNRQAQAAGIRFRVFCASLADVFDNEVSVQWRVDLFQLIAATPHLDWLLLTKRIGNVRNLLAESQHAAYCSVEYDLAGFVGSLVNGNNPPANVWIGATVVNQEEADRDIPKLLAVPARVRFLSMEPLLGPVDLHRFMVGDGHDAPYFREPLHWVIVGGESGTNARPMHRDWARSLRDQCQAAGVPFLFKQWGEFAPNWFIDDAQGGEIPGSMWVDRMGKKLAGRHLDGRTWDEVPHG